jgi:Flavin containing amine oxidoreductase
MATIHREGLSDAEWARLEPLLPPRTAHDHRRIIDGICSRERGGFARYRASSGDSGSYATGSHARPGGRIGERAYAQLEYRSISPRAYSYVRAGGLEAPRQLGAPLADTLFFAGEATDSDGHTGTVHGAMASGNRVVDEILRSR